MPVDVAGAEDFVAEVEAAAPFPLTVRPWRVQVDPEYARESGLLPLWLEPDIDYGERIIRLDTSEYRHGVPHPSMLLHEVMHLVQVDVLYPQPQTTWLTEGVCDYFAASWLRSPRLYVLDEREYPQLSRRLDHRGRYPEQAATQAGWIEQLITQLFDSGLAAKHPDVVDQIKAVEAQASATEIAPHSVGSLVGGAFWEADSALGRHAVWLSLLDALHSDPDARDLNEWLSSWLRAIQHHVGHGARGTVTDILLRRGFLSSGGE